MVTGLRAFAGAEPNGECELHRICAQGSVVRDVNDDDVGYTRGVAWMKRGDVRSTFTKARDMAGVSRVWLWRCFWKRENLSQPLGTMRMCVRKPWC
jgi:hypothetical protein